MGVGEEDVVVDVKGLNLFMVHVVWAQMRRIDFRYISKRRRRIVAGRVLMLTCEWEVGDDDVARIEPITELEMDSNLSWSRTT